MTITSSDIQNAAAPLFGHPFPHRDIERLSSVRTTKLGDLGPDLSWYFMNIAGWSTSPSRLLALSSSERQKVVEFLSKSFFDRFPEHSSNLAYIDEERTPQLQAELKCADEVRIMLLAFIEAFESTLLQPNLS